MRLGLLIINQFLCKYRYRSLTDEVSDDDKLTTTKIYNYIQAMHTLGEKELLKQSGYDARHREVFLLFAHSLCDSNQKRAQKKKESAIN